MAVGIAIGNLLSISDFELTPPIDAIKDIAAGSFDASVPGLISLGVPIGLFLMMYPAMTNVRLTEVGQAFRSPRQLAVVMILNYLLAPFFMLLLANLFVGDPELRTGLILYGLAPCIAMVIVFTYLARGNTAMALVFVALNSVIQMLLIPVYAQLLIGDVAFDVWVVFQSVLLYLGLPLAAGHIFNRIGDVFKIGIQSRDNLLGFIFHGTVIECAIFGHNFPAQKQIAGRIQIVGQRQGLVYGFNAVFACITRRLDAHFFTIDANLSLVARDGSGKRLHQYGFSCTIVAQNTDDLTGVEIDVYPLNGMNTAKSLVDINHLN